MADPRAFPDAVPPRMTGREVAALLLSVLGSVALVVGVGLYDWRAGLATAGALTLIIGVLLGMG